MKACIPVCVCVSVCSIQQASFTEPSFLMPLQPGPLSNLIREAGTPQPLKRKGRGMILLLLFWPLSCQFPFLSFPFLSGREGEVARRGEHVCFRGQSYSSEPPGRFSKGDSRLLPFLHPEIHFAVFVDFLVASFGKSK